MTHRESQTGTTPIKRKTAGDNPKGGAQNVLGTVTECRHLAWRFFPAVPSSFNGPSSDTFRLQSISGEAMFSGPLPSAGA